MTSEILTFERTVNVSPAQAYRAFSNSTALRQWFADAALADPRAGGRFYCWWSQGYYASGEFIEAKENERVSFTWHGRNEPGITQVSVAIEAQGDGTRIAVTHSGVGADAAWEDTIKQFERGWNAGLENLQSVLETGQDLRFTLRPMVGIMVDEFNPEIASELGLAKDEGVRLGAVIEGMGAAGAGLQKDDVIVGIGDADVNDWWSLGSALQRHRAGDKVAVAFYRGGERQTVIMELSARPLPEVPETPHELSEAVREINAGLDSELEAFLQGVSDQEASFRPEPDAWSVKETMAHLVTGERWLHTYITELIGDSESWHDSWGGNISERNAALLAVYPTIPELLDELKRSEAETVALLAALPAECVERKGSYTGLCYLILETPGFHARQHLDQMGQAVKAARESA